MKTIFTFLAFVLFITQTIAQNQIIAKSNVLNNVQIIKETADKTAPLIQILVPENVRGMKPIINQEKTEVKLLVTDPSGVKSVYVNDIQATAKDNFIDESFF